MSSSSSTLAKDEEGVAEVVDDVTVVEASWDELDAWEVDGAGSLQPVKLGEARGASVGKSVRREPGVWPLKKLSGVARAERLRARIAYQDI